MAWRATLSRSVQATSRARPPSSPSTQPIAATTDQALAPTTQRAAVSDSVIPPRRAPGYAMADDGARQNRRRRERWESSTRRRAQPSLRPAHGAPRRTDSVPATPPREHRSLPHHPTAPGELSPARARGLGPAPAIKNSDQVRLLTPVQFLARLAALVPPPRHLLVRFYGVWAPHSRWRRRVVAAAPEKNTKVTCASSKSDRHLRNSHHIGRHRRRRSTLARPPTSDSAQATSVPHPASPKPPLPSAAALPRAEEEPLARAHASGEEWRFRRLSRLAWATLDSDSSKSIPSGAPQSHHAT